MSCLMNVARLGLGGRSCQSKPSDNFSSKEGCGYSMGGSILKRSKKKSKIAIHLPLLLILVWVIFLLPLYLPNMGGSGLKLPVNIIAWLVMASVVALIWISKRKDTMQGIDSNTGIILTGVLILGIPLLYTSPQWFGAAVSRWGGLLGGLVFYISLLRYDLSHRKKYWIIAGILIAVTIQSTIAITQIFSPENVPAWLNYPRLYSRPYGVFQQVNVLATFVSIGIALVLMLFIFSNLTVQRSRIYTLKMCVFGVMLLIFTSLLVWLQSRIGWVSGILVSMMMFLIGVKAQSRNRVISALLLQGLAVSFALFIQTGGHVNIVDHAASSNARLIILDESFKMILSRPFLGWGYGSFEYSFQHFRASQHLSTLSLGVVRHPHNEILLWWVEGGLVSLTGFMVLLYAGIKIIKRAWRALDVQSHKDRYRGCFPLLLIVALTPMLLHAQTEYPFNLSAPTWLIFLLLLAMLQSQFNMSIPSPILKSEALRLVDITIISASVIAIIFFAVGLYANLILTSFERNGLIEIRDAEHAMNFDLGINSERWLYDKNLHGLIVFSRTKERKLLQQYRDWAKLYLSKRVDRNVYGNLCGVLFLLKDEESYLRVKKEAHLFFPDDPRFKMDFISD